MDTYLVTIDPATSTTTRLALESVSHRVGTPRALQHLLIVQTTLSKQALLDIPGVQVVELDGTVTID